MDYDEVFAEVKALRRDEYSLIYTKGSLSRFNSLHDVALARNNLKADYPLLFIEAERRINALHARKKRLNKRLQLILKYNNPMFCTLTFSDDHLGTHKTSLRKLTSDWLRQNFGVYIANRDETGMFERPHYHAVVSVPLQDFSWPYGYASFKSIRCPESDSIKLSTYVFKMCSHAFKGTSDEKVIYSRGSLDGLPLRESSPFGDVLSENSYHIEDILCDDVLEKNISKNDIDNFSIWDYVIDNETGEVIIHG